MSDVGMKHDTGKAPIARGFARYFPRAIEAVSLISLFGFEKYKEWGGWKKVPDAFNRYDDAHGRHDNALQRGETHCPESGKMHLSHRAWNALATLELYLIEEEAKRAEETLRKDQSWADAANEPDSLLCYSEQELADRFDRLRADAFARINHENIDGSPRRETFLVDDAGGDAPASDFTRCSGCTDYACAKFFVCCHPPKFTTCGACESPSGCGRNGACAR
jgi:hypothetical protein